MRGATHVGEPEGYAVAIEFAYVPANEYLILIEWCPSALGGCLGR